MAPPPGPQQVGSSPADVTRALVNILQGYEASRSVSSRIWIYGWIVFFLLGWRQWIASYLELSGYARGGYWPFVAGAFALLGLCFVWKRLALRRAVRSFNQRFPADSADRTLAMEMLPSLCAHSMRGAVDDLLRAVERESPPLSPAAPPSPSPIDAPASYPQLAPTPVPWNPGFPRASSPDEVKPTPIPLEPEPLVPPNLRGQRFRGKRT